MKRIPQRKLTGLSEFKYITEEADWRKKLLNRSLIDEYPIAWTPYQQSLYNGTPIDDIVKLRPDKKYGETDLLVPPKVLMLGLDGISFGGEVDLSQIYGPIADELKDNKIIVMQCETPYESALRVLFRMFLPHEAEEDIEDVSSHFGLIINTLPKVTVENWIAGEVFYADVCTTLTYTVGPYFDYDDGDPSNELTEYTNLLDAHIEQIKESFPRYEKFGYHVVFCNPNDGQESRPKIKTLMERICNVDLGPDYGVSLDVIEDDFLEAKPQVYESIRDKVVEFFNL